MDPSHIPAIMRANAREEIARIMAATRSMMTRGSLTPAPTPLCNVTASKTANRPAMRQTAVSTRFTAKRLTIRFMILIHVGHNIKRLLVECFG